MNKKTILISIDGMRPDGLKNCSSEAVEFIKSKASYTFNAKTVYPSITLPCHMSLFYGVEPMRHGIISNTYVPQVHQIKGLFEKVNALGGTSAIFYGWEPMRDVAPAGTCKYATYINSYTEESVDYPEYGYKVATAVAENKDSLGILCCGTGIGISMAANKVKGIRACCCSDAYSAKLTRQHNDANVLCMGGRVVSGGLAEMMVDLFLETEFEGGRHQRRIDKITAIENEQ